MKRVFGAMRHISTGVADAAAHPSAQMLVLALCILWLATGGSEATLASTMSIGSFILTQMVLNQQRRREAALHLKIDELVLSKTGARDEVAGIEHKSEAEIEALRDERRREEE